MKRFARGYIANILTYCGRKVKKVDIKKKVRVWTGKVRWGGS